MVKDIASRSAPADNSSIDLSVKRNRNEEFGKRLYKALLDKSWNQSDLARAAGVGRDSISQYVRGKTVPTPQNLKKIAQCLNVSEADLYPHYELAGFAADEPAHEFKAVPGDTEHLWVRVNMKLPKAKALEIFAIING